MKHGRIRYETDAVPPVPYLIVKISGTSSQLYSLLSSVSYLHSTVLRDIWNFKYFVIIIMIRIPNFPAKISSLALAEIFLKSQRF